MRACPYCAEEIQDAAVVCRFCNRELPITNQHIATAVPPLPRIDPAPADSPDRSFIAGLVVVVVLIVIAIGVKSAQTPEPRRPAVPSSYETAPVNAPEPERPTSGVTLANYYRLTTGMSYQSVVEILGEPGEEVSRTEMLGMVSAMYQWTRWGGANMNAIFQDNRLISKAQLGLR